MADKKKSGEKKKRASGLSVVPLLFGGLALAFLIKGSLILLLVGMLPSVITYYADIRDNRRLFRVVLTCNLAGILPFLTELVMRGNDTGLLLHHLMNPRVWFIMYASAGIGYMLVKGLPVLLEFFYELSNAAQIARLQSLQNRLIEEWGPELQRTQ